MKKVLSTCLLALTLSSGAGAAVNCRNTTSTKKLEGQLNQFTKICGVIVDHDYAGKYVPDTVIGCIYDVLKPCHVKGRNINMVYDWMIGTGGTSWSGPVDSTCVDKLYTTSKVADAIVNCGKKK
ncbi:MAG: hypothetical protein LBL52_02425 [Rickettsiales bacterium]|jgi:hypothetical protein|nr:hypothetical protein [Rickettsiales bacterium]